MLSVRYNIMVHIKIVKHDGSENDEHTYWGSVFYPPTNDSKTKELKDFDPNTNTVSAHFVIDNVPANKQFIACVYGYDNEDEDLDIARCQIEINHPGQQEEVIDFPGPN